MKRLKKKVPTPEQLIQGSDEIDNSEIPEGNQEDSGETENAPE